MNVIIEKIEDYSDEVIEQIKVALVNFLEKEIVNDLNLDRLDCIYIPNDFGKAVMDFQISINSGERGHTQNDQGEAFGKVISWVKEGKEIDRVFINKFAVLSLFGDSEDVKQTSINLIHHELCHVHDNFNFEKMKDFNEQLKARKSVLNNILTEHSLDIWGEYIVPKMSARTKKIEHAFDVQDILDSISFVNLNMKQAREGYFEDQDVTKVFHEAQLLGGFLLKKMSTLYGNYKGILGSSDTQLMNALDEIFIQHDMEEIWGNLKNNLWKLESEYPNWSSIEILNDLNDTVLSVWWLLGIYPKDTANGIYINVSNT